MKKIVIASILVVGLAAGFAFAHEYGHDMRSQGKMWDNHYGMMGSGMMGSGMMGQRGNLNCPNYYGTGQGSLTAEQQQQYLDATLELRQKLHNKRFELIEAQRNPKTKAEQLGTLQKEIIDLQTQLNAKAQELQPAAQ